MKPRFLDGDDVVELHKLQLSEIGGLDGIRDRGLLDSAVAQPKATWGGEFLHKDIFAMAAAYLFHIAMNHPFVDGNKRTAAVTALAFLRLNAIPINPAKWQPILYGATIKVATGELGKDELTELFRRLAKPRR